MASTNKTSNLELSQFIATDTPTWLVDYNGDMDKIDAGVGRVKELAETASTQAVGVASGLQATNQNVTTLSGQVANVQNQANTNTASVNGINNRLGNTDISGIGDGTITGAIRARNSNLNIRYNEETDTVQIFYNGEWVNWKSGNLKNLTLLANGILNVNYSWNGAYRTGDSGGNGGFSNGELYSSANSGIIYQYYTKVDVTKYSRISCKARVNKAPESGVQGVFGFSNSVGIAPSLASTSIESTTEQEYQLDITSLSGELYLMIQAYGLTAYVSEFKLYK